MKRLQSIVVLFALAWTTVLASDFRLATNPCRDPDLSQDNKPVQAKNGMVVSTNELASRVGVEILKKGGNAVDAAIGVAFALAVTHPAAGNLGGGGFMMIRQKDGKTTAIDYRETAPAAARRNVYIDANGELIKEEGGSLVGYRASGTPGTVRGMELALNKYGSGKFSWSQLIEPARKLAADGFRVNFRLEESLREQKDLLSRYAETKRIYLNSGRGLRSGDRLRQPDLARTFARLQKNGPDEFYSGETAKLIAADMKANNGLITEQDLAGYAVKEREPVRGSYRGHEIVSMAPPSSGGAVLIEMLNVLEGYDLKKFGWCSADRFHLLAETMKRAFADRAVHFGDPDFVNVSLSKLMDKAYAAKLRTGIDLTTATPSKDIYAADITASESEETTHFAVVDRFGNAVSNTYTLNNSYGSGVVARGTGILMNNEMDDFAVKPGAPNLNGLTQGENNAVAPKKRPLSSMSPTFVMRKDGTLWFTIGTPGGPTIINTNLQVIINMIDFGMDIQQAIQSPRIHHQWLPDHILSEPAGLSKSIVDELIERGHKFTDLRKFGDAQGIVINSDGSLSGATDIRLSDGQPVGY